MFVVGIEKTAAFSSTLKKLTRNLIPGQAATDAKNIVKKHRGVRIMKGGHGIGWSHVPQNRISKFLNTKGLT